MHLHTAIQFVADLPAIVLIAWLCGPACVLIGVIRRKLSQKQDLKDHPPAASVRIADGRVAKPPRGRATEGTNMIGCGLIITVGLSVAIYMVHSILGIVGASG